MNNRPHLCRRYIRSQKLTIALTLAVALSFSVWFDTVDALEAVEPQAVDFNLLDVEGKPLRLSSYRGRWVVINFWATWCAPCLREIPELAWVNEKYNTKVVVIGINYETINRVSLKNFMSKHNINYTVVRIGEDLLTPFEPLLGLPSTFFVNPQGFYVSRHTGVVTARDIKRLID